MIAALTVALGLLSSQADEPFVDLGYEAALAEAKDEDRLLLLYLTYPEAEPCQRMLRDIWGNEGIRAWMSKNAIAIRVDIEKERELAERFWSRLDGAPTTIAFLNGEPSSRVRGLPDAKEFLSWGRAVHARRHLPDGDLLARHRFLAKGEDAQKRRLVARDLLNAEEDAAALEHYLWLWTFALDSKVWNVNSSRFLDEIHQLKDRHEPAQRAFTKLLDDLQARIHRSDVPDFDEWEEWISMCSTFDEEWRILEWYDKRKEADGRLVLGRGPGLMRRIIVAEVRGRLMDAERYADAIRLFGDPVEHAKGLIKEYERSLETSLSLAEDENTRADIERFEQRELAGDLSELYGALLVAGQRKQATAVATLLIDRLDEPSSRLALVRAGIDATNQAHDDFLRWLDEAEAGGGKVRFLRRRLDRLTKESEKAEKPATGGDE